MNIGESFDDVAFLIEKTKTRSYLSLKLKSSRIM